MQHHTLLHSHLNIFINNVRIQGVQNVMSAPLLHTLYWLLPLSINRQNSAEYFGNIPEHKTSGQMIPPIQGLYQNLERYRLKASAVSVTRTAVVRLRYGLENIFFTVTYKMVIQNTQNPLRCISDIMAANRHDVNSQPAGRVQKRQSALSGDKS
jgi:hypothetical protein